jgi:hypothetical protein
LVQPPDQRHGVHEQPLSTSRHVRGHRAYVGGQATRSAVSVPLSGPFGKYV